MSIIGLVIVTELLLLKALIPVASGIEMLLCVEQCRHGSITVFQAIQVAGIFIHVMVKLCILL
jgi:hypothetical protein